MKKASSDTGLEKRGVVEYGWTPPPDSPVSVEPGSTLDQDKLASADAALDALDNDVAKRLAQRFLDLLE